MSASPTPLDHDASPPVVLPREHTAPRVDEDAAWHLYGDLTFEALVSVPLKELRLADLARVQAGTVFRSATFATEGAALSACGVFLANVSLEATEDRLGFRINNFAPMRPRPAAPGSITGLRDVSPGTLAPTAEGLMDMRVGLALCFGTRRMQLREAVQLTSGDLVPLDRGLRDLVSVMANGRPVASGKLVLIGGCYAVEILTTEPDAPAPGAEHGRGEALAAGRVRLVQDPDL